MDSGKKKICNRCGSVDERVLAVLQKALKESHSSEIEYHTASVNEINKQLDKAQRRLEAIYEDKIDNKITPDFYQRKFTEYTKDKEGAMEALKKSQESNTKYYEVGFAIHELASKAAEIYRSPKATVEDKRLLLSKVFSNISLEPNSLATQYTAAFEFLANWMPKVNSSFELGENGSIKRQKSDFSLSHPVLCAIQDSNL